MTSRSDAAPMADGGGVVKPAPAQIRAAREAAGLTQQAAAKLVGLRRGRIAWSEYEAGRRSPSAQTWALFVERVRSRDAVGAAIVLAADKET